MDVHEFVPIKLPDVITYVSFAWAWIAGIYSLAVWWKIKRQRNVDNELITIQIVCEEQRYVYALPGKIRRKNLTRAQVQGLLGILPTKNKNERYSLSYLTSRQFFRSLEEAQEKNSVLSVELTGEELAHSDLAELAQQGEN